MHYFLGVEVWQSPENIFLKQGKYAVEKLKRFDMLKFKSMNTPMETKLKLLVDIRHNWLMLLYIDRSLVR
jgi:lipopolysaccharide/colanic/teichoic acid biosynthesis glycosyltransferase